MQFNPSIPSIDFQDGLSLKTDLTEGDKTDPEPFLEITVMIGVEKESTNGSMISMLSICPMLLLFGFNAAPEPIFDLIISVGNES